MRSSFRRLWGSFSFVGLTVGTLFFAASLSPSLLPRHFATQGILSGFALAVGYGVGVGAVLLWRFLELPPPGAGTQRVATRIATAGVLVAAVLALWRATVWQDSIRSLMEMPPLQTAYAPYVAAIAAVVAGLLVLSARLLARLFALVDRRLRRFLPRRIAYALSAVLISLFLLTVGDRLVARLALHVADAVFLKIDGLVDDGIEPPGDTGASGSAASRIAWDSIGRQGKEFIAAGPSQRQIAAFWGQPARRPLRVYAGLRSAATAAERAELALEELKRAGGFDRALLIVATPTGTGWLDPGAVDTVEYLHRGDTAIVGMQYSYLPSWITILVEPEASKEAARALFDAVYGHWKTLPRGGRPRLYLHGLSLGALGSESCADLFTLFDDPIQGGLFSGPPFPSTRWATLVKERNPDSPAWLPTFRDASMVRFSGRQGPRPQAGSRWGKMRFLYIQHASDPMVFFSPRLLFRKPDWLAGSRGPDVSPYLKWQPIVTFLQIGFDLPMATNVPIGYGHNYAPASYIDAWIEVTQPDGWTVDHTVRLKQLFADAALAGNPGPRL